jgi:hypothetical protein
VITFGRKKRTDSDPDHGAAESAVEDCAAFLSGHLAEYLFDHHKAIPAWAWVNLLAHGTYEDLLGELASTQSREWTRSRAYLAAEVVAIATNPTSLHNLQETVLRPLELSFASSSDVRQWSPSQLARHVNAALTAYRAGEEGAARACRYEGRHSA